jgi:DNA-binding NtrC family response regulator
MRPPPRHARCKDADGAGVPVLVRSLDVLIVDDRVEEACSVARLLRQKHRVRIAIGLRDAVHEISRQVPDVVICALDMPPYRGDALLAMVAVEHPSVRRILLGAPGVRAMTPDAAHAVVSRPLLPSALLAAIHDE